MAARWGWWLVMPMLVLACWACDSDSAGATDTGAAADTVTMPETAGDTTGDAFTVPPPVCAKLPALGPAFPLFPEPEGMQFHPYVAFDGEALWATWTGPGPDDSGDFAIWAARFHCNGEQIVAPFRVDPAPHGNAIDSAVAVQGDTVLVAWQVDTHIFPHNLYVHGRAFAIDGSPVGEVETLDIWRDGQLQAEANAWLPDVVADPAGGFALAASWGSPDATGWQAMWQRLQLDGKPAGASEGSPEEILVPYVDAAASQVYPVVAARRDGAMAIAWERQEGTDSSRVEVTWYPPGGDTAAPLPPEIPVADGNTAGPFLSAAHGGDPVYLAGFANQPRGNVFLSALGAGTVPLWLGSNDQLDHTPVVAAGPAGGAVLWLSVRSGVSCDVFVQGFADVDGVLQALGEPRLLNAPEEDDDHAALSVYRPSLTRVGTGLYLAVWAEGHSPDIFLRAQYLMVSEEAP